MYERPQPVSRTGNGSVDQMSCLLRVAHQCQMVFERRFAHRGNRQR